MALFRTGVLSGIVAFVTFPPAQTGLFKTQMSGPLQLADVTAPGPVTVGYQLSPPPPGVAAHSNLNGSELSFHSFNLIESEPSDH